MPALLSDPVFAPDGKHLAAIERRASGTAVEVMRVDGTRPHHFDSGTVETDGFGRHVAAPTWGPS